MKDDSEFRLLTTGEVRKYRCQSLLEKRALSRPAYNRFTGKWY